LTNSTQKVLLYHVEKRLTINLHLNWSLVLKNRLNKQNQIRTSCIGRSQNVETNVILNGLIAGSNIIQSE